VEKTISHNDAAISREPYKKETKLVRILDMRATCRRFDTIRACDGRTDGIAIASTALAMRALRRAVIKPVKPTKPITERTLFFSGVPLVECCRVDDTSPERIRSLAFLQAEWIPMLADCTSASIPLSQVASRSPPVSWWSERRINSSLMILPGT